jgi:hypothetical protein
MQSLSNPSARTCCLPMYGSSTAAGTARADETSLISQGQLCVRH